MQESVRNEGIFYTASLSIYVLHSPVNLLHTGRYRLVYAIIFGAMHMSSVFVSLVLDDPGLCSSGSAAGMALCNKGEYSATLNYS